MRKPWAQNCPGIIDHTSCVQCMPVIVSNTENAVENKKWGLTAIIRWRMTGWYNYTGGIKLRNCNQVECMFNGQWWCNKKICSHLLVYILQFQEFYFIVATLAFAVLHAAFAACMITGIISKANRSTCLLTHAIVYLQYQSAGNSEVQKSN